ncbi:ABC transporter permease [Acuticoccus sp. MNP-M23]|uniref:ABC transporter permease n=1 Tax=Acuticoccus sp. MNP-M23 TaxID=3072793 RepID=UPI0028149FAE|nr:ABC transporter permease [Acuticoccus sp. MNP-M23]WMS44546.1 ABC transporter permease [Acuticoccus sp. MNP-M23]
MSWELLAVFLGSTIRLATPLLFAAMGEYVSERAGVLNMSLEGMMLTGAFAAAVASWATGNPMIGLLFGVLAALPVALLQAFLTCTLKANQIVTGLGINILVLGATTLGYREIFGARSRETIPGFDKWSPPGLGDLPVLGSAVFEQVWLVYLAIPIALLIWWVMTRSGLGVALRAVGDAPRAAAGAGLSVNRLRYGAILVTGSIAALGGAFLSIGDIHTFTEGMTRGAGYLAIAAVIFGNWRLGRTILACFVFGAATALQFQLPALGIEAPNALLIMLPYLLAFLAVAGLVGRQNAPRALAMPYP